MNFRLLAALPVRQPWQGGSICSLARVIVLPGWFPVSASRGGRGLSFRVVSSGLSDARTTCFGGAPSANGPPLGEFAQKFSGNAVRPSWPRAEFFHCLSVFREDTDPSEGTSPGRSLADPGSCMTHVLPGSSERANCQPVLLPRRSPQALVECCPGGGGSPRGLTWSPGLWSRPGSPARSPSPPPMPRPAATNSTDLPAGATRRQSQTAGSPR